MDLRQVKAIEYKNKQKWLKVNKDLTDHSGIYILIRHENGFKYAYVGQAKHTLTRLAEHLKGYQHIDLSLKKHGLYSESNQAGWQVHQFYYPESELDKMERFYIQKLANQGYQLRNKTSGGQDSGKFGIADNRPVKGFRDGIVKAKKDTQKMVAHLFNKYLDFSIKGKPNKLKQKAYEKFRAFLGGEDGDS